MVFTRLIKIAWILSIVVLFSGCLENKSLDPAMGEQIKDNLTANGFHATVTPNFLSPKIRDITSFQVLANKDDTKIQGAATSVEQIKEAIKMAQTLKERKLANINIGVPAISFRATKPQTIISSSEAVSVGQIEDWIRIADTLKDQNLTGINLNGPSLSFRAQLGDTLVESAGANKCILTVSWCHGFDNIDENQIHDSAHNEAWQIEQRLDGRIKTKITRIVPRWDNYEGANYCTKVETTPFPIDQITRERAEYNNLFAKNNINIRF